MRVLYLFNNSPAHLLDGIAAGTRPTNQVYGVVELRRLGHDVAVRDSVPRGRFRAPIAWLNQRFGLAIKDLATLRTFREHDVVVVKGSLSFSASLAGRIVGTKVVFLDSLLRPPANPWRRLIDAMTIRLAASVISYSRHQIQECRRLYFVSARHFALIPFCLDENFFRPVAPPLLLESPFALAVGADQSRDFGTLVQAMRGSSLRLTIVALPYLLKDVPRDDASIKILERVPYAELLELYSRCKVVVLPLKKWSIRYPSGITSLLEAKLLGRPIIAADSPILREYVTEEDGVIFVPPEDANALRSAIDSVSGEDEALDRPTSEGAVRTRARYSMTTFGDRFAEHLLRTVAKDRDAQLDGSV
jgi:glycosyltransferase involved in cell wall biosynthesis